MIDSVFFAAPAGRGFWSLNVARGFLRLIHWHAGMAFGVALCLGLSGSCGGIAAPPRFPCLALAALQQRRRTEHQSHIE